MEQPTPEMKKDYVEIPVGKWMGKARSNPWMISTVVLAIFLVASFFFNSGSGTTGNVVSADQAGENALNFIKSNPDLTGEVSIVSVQKASSGPFYQALLNYQGQQVPVYVTTDGDFLIAGEPIPLNGQANLGGTPTAPATGEPVDVSVDDDAVLGNANAPVTIVEFSDYQCPFCAKFWSDTLPQLKSEYIDTGKVKLVYRDFPLSIHPMAQKAAESTECVREKGGDIAYWKMHDKIFENQATLSEANLKVWAKGLGYDITTCLDSGKFADEVTADMNEGATYGVSGTPAFFINGKIVEGALPFAQFKTIIDAELAAAAPTTIN